MRNIIHLVSVSGGKDSTATLIQALTQFPESTFAVFADTGNEHETTLEYLDYLETALSLCALNASRLTSRIALNVARNGS